MRFPTKSRYKKVAKTVCEFFIKENITSFPINPFEIISRNKWGLITYSELARETNLTIDQIIETVQSEDGYTIWDGTNYTIAYNDKVTPPNRIRFTLMHEIGHIYLNHLIDFDETILNRSKLTYEKYRILENEANAFARNTLAPAIIVNRIKTLKGNLSVQLLMNIFQITQKAAKTRLDLLLLDRKYNFKYILFYLSRFRSFINQVSNSLWCRNCNYTFSIANANYCPICGNSRLEKNYSYLKGGTTMIYYGIELDENHRAKKCPVCENEIIVGDYCQICGTYLVNRCTGFRDEPFNRYQGPWHIDFEDSCGQYLSGEARFCHVCGSTSTFYESGLLKGWKEEIESNIDISEEDLPF